MKIQKLIRRLETLKKKHGNIEVTVFDTLELEKGVYRHTEAVVLLNCPDDGPAISLSFVDRETAESISESC
jgi:hypothetical protein